MDMDKMKKWMDMAKQFQQGQFWDSVFETEYTEKMMEQFTKTSSTNKPIDAAFPLVDIFTSNHELVIVLDLPGIRKEDIEISLTDYGLHVKGVANLGYPDMIKVQTERYNGGFERTIPLPETIGSGANISAKFDNGTIEIRIPKSNRVKEKIKIE